MVLAQEADQVVLPLAGGREAELELLHGGPRDAARFELEEGL